MKLSKKSIVTGKIIFLIIGVICLFILIGIIVKTNETYKRTSKIIQCSQFLKRVSGEPAYFTKNLNKPTQEFLKTISEVCSSHIWKISREEDLKEALEECFKMGGEGRDFFGARVVRTGIFIYCGRIDIQKNINFNNEEFIRKIKENEEKEILLKETELINLNENIIENFPKKFPAKKNYYLWYYAFKGDSSFLEKINNFISKNTWGRSITLFYFLNDKKKIEGFSNIVLTENSNLEEKIEDTYVIIPQRT